MTRSTPAALRFGGLDSLYRLSVEEYHQMIQAEILDEEDDVELLEGYLVRKMTRNPPHDTAVRLTEWAIDALLPTGWMRRSQSAITLACSEPEPDVVVARGNLRSYATRHPGPADLGLVIEVADSTLQGDRVDKARIYARAGIAIYWIVNLIDRQVEVFQDPTGPVLTPFYATTQVYLPGMAIPLPLDGLIVGSLAVEDLLP